MIFFSCVSANLRGEFIHPFFQLFACHNRADQHNGPEFVLTLGAIRLTSQRGNKVMDAEIDISDVIQ